MDKNKAVDQMRETSRDGLLVLGLSEGAVDEIMALNEERLGTLSAIARQLGRASSFFAQSDESARDSSAVSPTPIPYTGELPAGMTEDHGSLMVVQSPMVGVFYNCPAPDAPVFVNEGDVIEPGAEFGLIEAMKVFTPLALMGEASMRVVRVLAGNGRLVQQGQDLILLLPVE